MKKANKLVRIVASVALTATAPLYQGCNTMVNLVDGIAKDIEGAAGYVEKHTLNDNEYKQIHGK